MVDLWGSTCNTHTSMHIPRNKQEGLGVIEQKVAVRVYLVLSLTPSFIDSFADTSIHRLTY